MAAAAAEKRAGREPDRVGRPVGVPGRGGAGRAVHLPARHVVAGDGPVRSYCYKTAKVCRRRYITGLSTEWYPNGVLDGFYEWDGFATLRYQPFYRFAGGHDICLSANTNLAWAWQPCSDREAVRMGDLGDVIYYSNNWANPVNWALPDDLKTSGGSGAWPVAPPTVVCADGPTAPPSPSPLGLSSWSQVKRYADAWRK